MFACHRVRVSLFRFLRESTRDCVNVPTLEIAGDGRWPFRDVF